MRPHSLAASAVAAVALIVGSAMPAGAGGLYQYSFHSSGVEHQVSSGVGDDTGVCDAVEDATLTQQEAVHVQATEAGLTMEDVDALLDDDPDGVIVRVTYTVTGTFHVLSGGHTYDGHFTQWFGGGVSGPLFVVTFTFSVTGHSETGSALHAHFVSHFAGTDDLTKVEFDRGAVTGCLPPV
jgi:hypothetical protein